MADNRDCCDVADDMTEAALVNPSYSGGSTTNAAEGCAQPFDYNCDGEETPGVSLTRGCADFESPEPCPGSVYSQGDQQGYPLACGGQYIATACATVAGSCQNVGGGRLTLVCD